MIKKKKVLAVLLVLCLTQGIIGGFYPGSSVSRAVVSDFEGLKKVLETPGNTEISLERDVRIEKKIRVCGNKTLNGNGHSLFRGAGAGSRFGGTLLCVENGEFTLADIRISGGGDSESVQDCLYGRLIDIQGGEVYLEMGAVLCQNRNIRRNHDGGGAVLVKQGGKLVLDGGCIEYNQNVVGGAAVYVERGGSFDMKSGVIQKNRTEGIGAVEGFDGRGGAVYVEGKMKISGGMISQNRAVGYRMGGVVYGGAGGAVFAERSSELRITGGTISKNEAQTGPDLYLRGGSCRVGQKPELESVFLQKGAVITADPSLSESVRIQLIPQIYKNGICLAKTKSASFFVLRKKGGFFLTLDRGRLCLERARRETDAADEKGTDKGQRDKGQKNKKQNDKHVVKEKKQGESKKRNKLKMPSIKTASRYLFESEIRDYTEEDWESELLGNSVVDPGGFEAAAIVFRWEWGGLLANKAGRYTVKISLTGGSFADLEVHIVGDCAQNASQQEKKTYVRFTGTGDSRAGGDTEIWHFGPEEIRNAKKYMSQREDPFSEETNREFLALFGKCRQGERGLLGERE